MRTSSSSDIAVVANRLEGIVRSMINTLFRSSRSVILNTGRDFSCCILTAAGDLVAIADSFPIHVMAGPDIMARTMVEFHPLLTRGDAFLHNSPYHGNSHAADHAILVPVIDDSGVHRYTVLAKAHQADCGNSIPTTYHATARDVYEEGALIFPCVRVQTDYQDVADIARMCEARIRVPAQWRGDYLAMVGSARIGERRLVELGNEVGWEKLMAYTRAWLDYSEARMAAAIRELPAGRREAKTRHDPFPGVPEGIDISASVEIQPERGEIVVDLRENPDCQPCGLNLSEACARTAAMIGVFNSIGQDVPPNAGSVRRIRVLLRENCIVGIPRHPASCSVATTNLSNRVVNVVQRAIAELCDGRGVAEIGLEQPPSTAVLSGVDPRSGAAFVNEITLATTGGPASSSADGWLTFGAASCAGMYVLDSVELDELRHPIRIYRQEVIPDSEGAGTFRGAPAARVEYGPIGCSITVIFGSDGNVTPARGGY